MSSTTTALPCPLNFQIDPGSEVTFISGSDYPEGRCFAVTNVTYHAGVINSQNCNIISPNVVSSYASDQRLNVTGPPWSMYRKGLEVR